MIDEDLDAFERSIAKWTSAIGEVSSAMLISPDPPQYDQVSRLFPRAKVRMIGLGAWDLNDPFPLPERYDLAHASSVFMASPDPELWITNVRPMCRWFVLQDHIRRHRGQNQELGTGPIAKGTRGDAGDCMRFCRPPDLQAVVTTAYDLTRLGDLLVDVIAYPAGANDALSFCALIKGEIE